MKRLLAFKTIAFDTNVLPAGLTLYDNDSIKFFNADNHEEENIITQKGKLEEENFIKWILGSPAKDLLLNELGVGPNPFIDYSVKQPIIENSQSKPGDIDLLICDGHRAEHAIAFQCKPVKVTAFNQDEDNVNKLPDIRKAVDQVNKQRDNLGFYKNYLAVLIKVYGRKRSKNNVLFRGPSPETFKQIYEFPQRESLNSEVGIVFIEVCQPTGKSFDKMAQVGICVDQYAKCLVQSNRLTNRVKQYMSQKGVI